MGERGLCPTCRTEREGAACSQCGSALLPAGVFASLGESEGTRKVGRYALVEPLGSGGSGVVWKATDRALNRPVALKLLRADLPDDIRRLEREAQIAARLRHPNIVAIYEVGVSDGQAFIAMDYVDGKSADKLSLPLREAVTAVRDAALAVHYGHEQGVIHRDLKPGNLMIDASGRVYVMDFGMAKERSASSLSASGLVMGTPSYMSPEQAEGKSRDADARTDVWGLGATLYALLSGRPPFDGETVPEVMRKVSEATPAPLPRIARDLQIVVLRCLEKEPERRYPTARELAEDLTRFLQGEPILAKPASVFYRLGRAIGRRKSMSALVLVVLTLVVLIGARIQQRKEKGRGLLAEANAAFDRGDYALARSKYDEARGLRSAVPQDRYDRCLWVAGREEELAPLLRRSEFLIEEARRVRRLPDARHDEWQTFLREAIAAVDEGLKRDPTWATGYIARARIRVERNDLTGAVADYSEAIRHQPGLTQARFERGRAYIDLLMIEFLRRGDSSQTSRAMTELREKAAEDLRAGASSFEAHERSVLEAYSRFSEWKFHEAAEIARVAIEKRPRDVRLGRLRGAALARIGQLLEAADLLDEVVKSCWPDVLVFLERARIHFAAKDFPRSIQDCKQALRLDPDFALAHVLLSQARLEYNDWERALEDAERAVKADPSWSTAWAQRGVVLLAGWRLEKAREDLDRAVELDPRDTVALIARVDLRERLRDWKGRAEDFDRLLVELPEHTGLLADRGESWMRAAERETGATRQELLRRALGDFEAYLRLHSDEEGPRIRELAETCRQQLGR